MEMCKGLKEQIEYNRKGLKCPGELNEKDLVELVNGVLETAERWVEEDKVNEIQGSEAVTLLTDEGKAETLEKKPPGLRMAEHFETSPRQAEDHICHGEAPKSSSSRSSGAAFYCTNPVVPGINGDKSFWVLQRSQKMEAEIQSS